MFINEVSVSMLTLICVNIILTVWVVCLSFKINKIRDMVYDEVHKINRRIGDKEFSYNRRMSIIETDIRNCQDDVDALIQDLGDRFEEADSEETDEHPSEELDDIHLISADEYWYDNSKGYARDQLIYLSTKEQLFHCDWGICDRCLPSVQEPDKLIGDALRHLGVRSGDENIVYIQNSTFKTKFMIKRVNTLPGPEVLDDVEESDETTEEEG